MYGVPVLSGGTRKGPENLRRIFNRRWDAQKIYLEDECPFENLPQEVVTRYIDRPGWGVTKNLYTPFPGHFLIVPETCWSLGKLWEAGGNANLGSVIAIARRHTPYENFFLMFNVGWFAGQNIYHFHAHLIPNTENPRETSPPLPAHENEILRKEGFLVGTGGYRTGQCMIFHQCSWDDGSFRLATIVSRLIDLGNRCLLTTSEPQGLPPDYRIVLSFQNRRFLWGTYIPILNHLGGTEDLAIMDPTHRHPFVLAVPHEEMAKYYRSNLT